MEESQKQIEIHSFVSPDLLLNFDPKPKHKNHFTYRSYFHAVQKYRDKQKQYVQNQKVKTNFVQNFYEKLKQQLQNNSDSKKLKQNLNLINICLKHKHTRHKSENVRIAQSKRFNFRTKHPTARQPLFENFYEQKARKIMKKCDKQNTQLSAVHKDMGLFQYYCKKVQKNFTITQNKIKKTIRQF